MDDFYITRAKMLGSIMIFTRIFYKILTGREFYISQPISRESHHIIVWKALTKIFNLETLREIINLPPGHHKSTMLSFWVAWCYAHYADCNFIYSSVGHELASKHTYLIKKIMSLKEYHHYFDVSISRDSSAKDNFSTTKGGTVAAFGAEGTVVGANAGLPNCDRFSGALIMDDMHKPTEGVYSDKIRNSVIENYKITLSQRPRGNNVPIIFLGQRVHEQDLPGFLLSGGDGQKWDNIILASPDENGHALDPSVINEEALKIKEKMSPYVYFSQYQQQPIPPGGCIFKEEEFVLMDDMPNILVTFITVDTAETDKNYNDPSVFSFWGIHRINHGDIETSIMGLYLIDCQQDWIDAGDLEERFKDFYYGCMRFKVPPSCVAIEKKNTGVTLIGTLKKLNGLDVRDIERTRVSGNKIDRYIEMQPYTRARRISLASSGKLWRTHNNKLTNLFIDHMTKITDNGVHDRDDICDTAYDAVKIALIDQLIKPQVKDTIDPLLAAMANKNNQIQNLRNKAYGRLL